MTEKSVFNPDFQQQDTSAKIVAGLERLSNAFRVLLWDHAKAIGLSPIQIQILIFLKYHAQALCNVSALAREFNLTKPTISDAIKVLHQKKLIEKIQSDIDKRAYSIKLNARGEEIVSQTEHFAAPVQKIIEHLGAKEQNQFFQTLSKIILQLNRKEILSVQRTCPTCRFFQKTKQGAYCKLLEQKLEASAIRLDCPEFEAIP